LLAGWARPPGTVLSNGHRPVCTLRAHSGRPELAANAETRNERLVSLRVVILEIVSTSAYAERTIIKKPTPGMMILAMGFEMILKLQNLLT